MDRLIFTILTCLLIASCGGTKTFHEYARAGDTVAIPVGMQPTFNKDNITVTIYPSDGGAPIVLPASDPAIRAIVNLYPDPISNQIISREISKDTTEHSQTYAEQVLFSANNDKDYYQTTVFVDLPSPGSLPTGITNIEVSGPSPIEGAAAISYGATLEIIEGTGVSNSFEANLAGIGATQLDGNMLISLSRASHTEVSFTASTLPRAIEINLSHGVGDPFVVNPLGYRKNLSWNDDGTNLKIIMTESQPGLIDNIKDYKFYIAGTVTDLQFQSLSSFDIDGNSITGTEAVLTAN
jgi:hypothetical protein